MSDTNQKTEKARRNRSAAYPSMMLAEAVEQLRQIHGDLGKGPYDRESAAKSLGYNSVSGASASKIAALVHYGLIQRVGGGYIETDLGTRIALPVDDDEENKALIEAFKSPSLFSKLINDFGGKSLPAKLEIVLVRQYKITEQASKDVARTFRDSAEYVGMLRNGFLNTIDNTLESPMELELPHIQKNDERNSSRSHDPMHSNNQTTVSVNIGAGLSVVFSHDLLLHVATGAFSKGIEQLSNDLMSLKAANIAPGTVGSDEDENPAE